MALMWFIVATDLSTADRDRVPALSGMPELRGRERFQQLATVGMGAERYPLLNHNSSLRLLQP